MINKKIIAYTVMLFMGCAESMQQGGVQSPNQRLYQGVKNNNAAEVAAALAQNAQINDTSQHTTPLIMAIIHGYHTVVQQLLNAGANPSIMMNGHEALHVAVKMYSKNPKNFAKIIIALKKAGASNTVTDTSGHSALQLAQKSGNKSLIAIV